MKGERQNLNAFRFGNGCGRRWGWWRGSDGWTVAISEGKLLRLQGRRTWEEGGRLDFWKWGSGVLGFVGREDEVVKFRRESHWWVWRKFCSLSFCESKRDSDAVLFVSNEWSVMWWFMRESLNCDRSSCGNTLMPHVRRDTYLEIQQHVNVNCEMLFLALPMIFAKKVTEHRMFDCTKNG